MSRVKVSRAMGDTYLATDMFSGFQGKKGIRIVLRLSTTNVNNVDVLVLHQVLIVSVRSGHTTSRGYMCLDELF
jgi:hypothetical protein